MKWFKHMSGASRDEKIVALEGEFGLIGYARYFKILEAIAEQMDESDKCEVSWRPWKWCQALGYSRRDHALSFLQALAKHGLCCLNANGELWSISVPKLLKIRARKKPIGSKTRQTEVEVEVEVDKEKEEKVEKEEKRVVAEKPVSKITPIRAPSALTPLAQKWNQICVSLPKVKVVSETWRRKEKIRIRELGEDEITSAMRKIEASKFCRGGNDRGWRATYQWLITNDSNVLKTLQGLYDEKKEPDWKEAFLRETAK